MCNSIMAGFFIFWLILWEGFFHAFHTAGGETSEQRREMETHDTVKSEFYFSELKKNTLLFPALSIATAW